VTDPRRPLRIAAAAGAILLLVAGVAALPLLRWQQAESARTLCQSNLRRISIALLQYSQDFDGRFPPVRMPGPNREWRMWVDNILQYAGRVDYFVCPANPAASARDMESGAPYP